MTPALNNWRSGDIRHGADVDPWEEPSEANTERVRRFKDPIHDYIPLGSLICSVIDTKQFQRLRHIKQLGTSYYVWPGASHNRFEHCLGVAFLAQTMAEHLQKSQPELGITDDEILCVTIAGLCHDLGHGPWSHVWDGLFIPQALPGRPWKHEDASMMMFDELIKENKIEISEPEAAFIKSLIIGEPLPTVDPAKRFLYEIVANKRNGLDVDKFDYIARDTRAVDQQGNLSLTRLIHSARVIDHQICFDIKDANQIYELCYTRFSLHKRIYNHRTAKAIEYMIIDALLAAEPYMQIAHQIYDPKRYVYLTDDIKTRIEATTQPELEEARRIFDRINTRDLYKLVDFKVFKWSQKGICQQYITPKSIVEAAKGLTGSPNMADLDPKHVIVDLSPMHYGMGNQNPLSSVKFYSKRNPNRCQPAGPGDFSTLMPAEFGEIQLYIYTRESRFQGIIQAGYRKVVEGLNAMLLEQSGSHSSEGAFQTAPTMITPFPCNSFTSVPKDFPGLGRGKVQKRLRSVT